MVYCGKASQGCKNCRIRRIKCDKVKPECSQCIRVGKKCPGYRDQLSLMFRDESSKVIQKAHAQWGVNDGEDGSHSHPSSSMSSAGPSSSSSPQSTTWTATPISGNTQQLSPPTPISPNSSHPSHISPSAEAPPQSSSWPVRLCTPIGSTIEEQGAQFYVDRYLVGHPDEPKTASEVSRVEWLGNPAIRDIMVAVGVASMSNLKGDKSLMITARQKYGQALRQVGELIKTPVVPDFEVTMRAVVMLAMFELVKGNTQGIKHVHAHVVGGVALLRSWCPIPNVPFGGVRSLVQLCYCMFIPAHLAGLPLAAPFYEWVSFSRSHLDAVDHPAIDLGLLVARFVDLSAYIQSQDFSNRQTNMTSTLHQLLELDGAFADWETGLGEIWPYRTERSKRLPPAAAFDQEYHVYYDMWTARMWGHYRWARILINQTIIELVDKDLQSGSPSLPPAVYKRCIHVIRQQARDTLVSTPSHWRHPLLDDKSPIPVENSGGAGSGAAGLPLVLFQLKVAACAPSLPAKFWDWAYGIMECIWGDLGMLHAKIMMDAMITHRDSLHQVRTASSSPSEGQHSPSSRSQ